MINLIDINDYGKTPEVKAGKDVEKVKKAAQEFESFFISQMFQHMFTGLEPDGMFGGGHGEKVWQSFLVDEYGKMMAKSGGIGIGDKVLSFMLKSQEV